MKLPGFSQSQTDHSLFVQHKGSTTTMVLIYVDDIIITGNNDKPIQNFILFLYEQFNIKDLGNFKYFLGIKVARTKTEIVISKCKYTLDILNDVRLLGAKLVDFSIEQNLKLPDDQGELLKNPSNHRRLIGRLIHLTIIRSDIAYFMNISSQFVHAPRKPYWDTALRVAGYLKNSLGLGLLFSAKSNLQLRAYCDANWARQEELQLVIVFLWERL